MHTSRGKKWELPLGVAVLLLLTIGTVIALVGGQATKPSGGKRPAPGFTLITGSATVVRLSETLVDPIRLPVEIKPRERGGATATFTGVMVDGEIQTVVWTGGATLRLEGPPAPLYLDDPVSFQATGDAVELGLAAVVGHLDQGAYHLEGDLAVGKEGLARPATSVDFEAVETAHVTFTGSSGIRLPPTPQRREGPGEIHAEGTFERTTNLGRSNVSNLDFGPGPYRLSMVWNGTTILVEGELREAADQPPLDSPGTSPNS